MKYMPNLSLRGNKYQFGQIFVEALEEFPIFLSNQKLARALTSTPGKQSHVPIHHVALQRLGQKPWAQSFSE